MNKKKITTSLMAVALVSSLAVGSLAWFTSQDSVTNPFSTASTDTSKDNRVDAGIKIDEIFNKDTATNITPGENVQKEVRVHSTANYDQFVKAEIVKTFTYKGEPVDYYVKTKIKYKNDQGQDVDAEKITYCNSKDKDGNSIPLPAGAEPLNTSLINYTLTKDSGKEIDKNNKWFDNTKTTENPKGDGFYYYNGVLPAGVYTDYLINDVTLSSKAGNEYKNLGFNVVVNAKSIQAANKAANTEWASSPDTFKTMVNNYENTAEKTEAVSNEKVQAAKAK